MFRLHLSRGHYTGSCQNCDKCGYEFAKSTINIHKNMHHEVKSFEAADFNIVCPKLSGIDTKKTKKLLKNTAKISFRPTRRTRGIFTPELLEGSVKGTLKATKNKAPDLSQTSETQIHQTNNDDNVLEVDSDKDYSDETGLEECASHSDSEQSAVEVSVVESQSEASDSDDSSINEDVDLSEPLQTKQSKASADKLTEQAKDSKALDNLVTLSTSKNKKRLSKPKTIDGSISLSDEGALEESSNSALNDTANESVSNANKNAGESDGVRADDKVVAPQKDTSVNIYKCGACNVHFLRHQYAFKHVLNHVPLDIFSYIECKLCKLQFEITNINGHVKKHHRSADLDLSKILVVEYQPTAGGFKTNTYYAIDKVQYRLVSTTTDDNKGRDNDVSSSEIEEQITGETVNNALGKNTETIAGDKNNLNANTAVGMTPKNKDVITRRKEDGDKLQKESSETKAMTTYKLQKQFQSKPKLMMKPVIMKKRRHLI